MKKILKLPIAIVLLVMLVGCFNNLEQRQRQDFNYVYNQYRKLDTEFDKVDYSVVVLLKNFYNGSTLSQSLVRWLDIYIDDIED